MVLAASEAASSNSGLWWAGAELTWDDAVMVALSTSEPGAPGDFTAATAVGDTSVTLGWSAPEKPGGSAITGYEYRRSADGGENWGDWTTIANSSEKTTHLVTGLSADTAYTFQMRAVNDSGSGLHAPAVSALTSASGPAVSSLALSDAGTDSTYAIGDAVSVTVTFSDSVDVTDVPQLDIDVAGTDETLSYSSGTGTDSLLFTGYTVAEGDSDTDGIEIAANELELNGGTIRKKGSTTARRHHHARGPRPAQSGPQGGAG